MEQEYTTEERYITGIKIKLGCKSLIYRDARNIKTDKNILTFITAVTCLGNNRDINDRPVYTLFDTHHHPECGCYNPVVARYDSVVQNYVASNVTQVTIYLQHTEGYEIFRNK